MENIESYNHNQITNYANTNQTKWPEIIRSTEQKIMFNNISKTKVQDRWSLRLLAEKIEASNTEFFG